MKKMVRRFTEQFKKDALSYVHDHSKGSQHFSGHSLSDTFQNHFVVMVQPFYWAKVVQAFLYATCVVESFRICKDGQPSLLTCSKMPPMNSFS